ncbi:MAG: hypothetical protein ACRBCJ_12780 [Hyphomicrobiaceae bacterium]
MSVPSAMAQSSQGIVKESDAVVTSFSGTRRSDNASDDVHPLDETTINRNGVVLRVLDLSKLNGPADGQLAKAKRKLSIKAGEIGQVFGVALDQPDNGLAPNIFAAATSLYGLQIVGKRDGKAVRLVKGEPGATWMPGQFGQANGGGPGTIWKIDGETGNVSLFTTIKSGPNDNAGAGLGGLTYDFVSRQLFVANLETGFVHRIDETGKDLGFYDHGTKGRPKADFSAVAYDASKRVSINDPQFDVENPETWGLTDKRRRVVGVAVSGDRLYYSVADGPQVWSVGLDSKGGFLDDARMEFDFYQQASNNSIMSIAFDGPGEMYLSQRGLLTGSYDYSTFAKPKQAEVLHLTWSEDDKVWQRAETNFPVGLSPPHRATNGGLALGYGYDEKGRHRRSVCNATLWTSGDRLMGDGEVVSGLQGASKVNIDPAQSWFVDLDGKKNSDDAFGEIGAIAFHMPYCGEDPSTRPEPIEYPEPELAWPDLGPDSPFPDDDPSVGWPPIGMPGLDITKVCQPSAFGGVISCTITVKNTGSWFFADPITVSDATTIAAGPGAGGAINVVSVTPDGAEWSCTPTPTINLTCGLLAEHLPPGASRAFTVDVDTSTMVANGNVGFTNCASLGAPYWGVACDNAGVDLTVKKTAEPGCGAGADCTFKLEITNNSPSPFNGQVQLTDQMFLGAVGGALNAPIVVSADLGCAGGNPGALPFSCLATMTLAAGETKSFDMTATMPAAPPNYWARNCFAATAPGLVPGDLATAMPPGGGSLGSGGAVSCAWMQVGVPAPHANLKMKKTAQECGKLPGDPNTVTCDYTISITNIGPSDFNSPIAFDETVDPAATLILNEAGWACPGGAPTYACSSAAAVAIAAGETLDIPATVTTPRDTVEANACKIPNKVTLTTPAVNAATNYLGTDDEASADGDAFLLEFDEGGAAIILCDPTNLKTTQVAKGPCDQTGDGWRCEFDVTIENTGPDPYKGEIRLLDILSIAPLSVSYSGIDGWSRTPSVGHDMYRLPKRTIEKGESVKLDLAVNIPDGNYCSLTNTAHMTFPVLKRHNGDKTDDTATATAEIPRPECKRPKQCKPGSGEIRTSSGACACAPGSTRNKDGVCAKPREPEPTPEPISEPPPQTGAKCPDGYPIPRNGVCPCPRGETWDKIDKICVGGDDDYDPPIDDPVVIDDPPPPPPLCRLLPGQVRTKSGRCVCANGRKWNKRTFCQPRRPWCTPRIGEVFVDGRCKCANGRKWNSKTFCDAPADNCRRPGSYQAAPGVCCPVGTVYRDYKCRRPIDPVPTCTLKPGQIRTSSGACVCANGNKWNAKTNCGRCRRGDMRCICKQRGLGYDPRRRRCITPSNPAKDCKAKGWIWIGKTCYPPRDPAKQCRAKGWTWTGEKCVRPNDPAKQCRQKGWTWNGYECLPPRNPAKDCKAKGWKWNGKTCYPPRDPGKACRDKGWKWTGYECLPPRNPAKDCKAKGWKWTGKKCIRPLDKAQVCKARGWRWTGKTCIRPLSPAQRCKAKGWKWTGSRCIRPVKPCPKGTYGPGLPNCKKIILKQKTPKVIKKYVPKVKAPQKLNFVPNKRSRKRSSKAVR